MKVEINHLTKVIQGNVVLDDIKISLPTRQPLGQGKNPEYDMEKGNDDACQQREIQPLASKTALQLKT